MHLIQLQSNAQIFLGPWSNMSCNRTTETEHNYVPPILELYFIRDYFLEEDWTIALYNIRHENHRQEWQSCIQFVSFIVGY